MLKTEIEALRAYYERKFGSKDTREADRAIEPMRTDSEKANAWRQLVRLS